MAKNKPLKDEEYDSIDEIQTTLDRHTDKLNRIEAGLVSIWIAVETDSLSN